MANRSAPASANPASRNSASVNSRSRNSAAPPSRQRPAKWVRRLRRAWNGHLSTQLSCHYQESEHRGQIAKRLPALMGRFSGERQVIQYLAARSRTMYPTHADYDKEARTFAVEFLFDIECPTTRRVAWVAIVFAGRMIDGRLIDYHCYPNRSKTSHGRRVPTGW